MSHDCHINALQKLYNCLTIVSKLFYKCLTIVIQMPYMYHTIVSQMSQKCHTIVIQMSHQYRKSRSEWLKQSHKEKNVCLGSLNSGLASQLLYKCLTIQSFHDCHENI